ncbi:hypothetical protein TIFTF001_008046 [Ficus carica]|uniref:Uncharacterized protein n=1 Tax=Ficus carica TaxID=3494 RepID=A0AA88D086_FICCA|nr:hypothetical protein TIFTF001_008046 [Ficus carica]
MHFLGRLTACTSQNTSESRTEDQLRSKSRAVEPNYSSYQPSRLGFSPKA